MTVWISHKYACISFLSLPPTSSSHTSRSSQSTRLSSLCYTVTSHYLSVLHMVMLICIMNFQSGVFFQLLSCIQLVATSWDAAHQASLSFTISWRLLKLMSIELVMPSNHHILCWLLLCLPSIFPSIRVFSNESALCIRWPNIGASSSVLPVNIQDWFPLGLTGLISSLSSGFSSLL